MPKNQRISCLVWGAIVWLLLLANRSLAEQITFTLDANLSVIQASGVIPIANNLDADPQGPGADTTTYSGTIDVELDDLLAPTSIEFLSANILAANSGSWLPDTDGGSVGSSGNGDATPGTAAPANYGLYAYASGFGELYLALRDIGLTATSSPLTVDGSGTFASVQTLIVTQGTTDYNFNSESWLLTDLAVSDSLVDTEADNMADDGSYVVDGNVATLTLPIDILFVITEMVGEFPATVFELSYSGTIIATASLAGDGDFDADGDTDGFDFLLWQRGFSDTYTADALADWEANFAQPSELRAAGAPVPEPASLILAVFGLATAHRVGRRHLR